MAEKHLGKGSNEHPQQPVKRSPKEYAVGIANAAKVLVQGVVEFLPHSTETRHRLSEAEIRKQYKYAVLKPYMDKLPVDVVEVMLDIDTNSVVDKHGNVVRDEKGQPLRLYDVKRHNGEVREVIERELGVPLNPLNPHEKA